ncbi:hypothetical protein IQ07DRAFT_258998 [Pyrenochaeta sp. DS3sAY3a]|nr:hypothetical protein IQ07DRAFT_258998 [Pyrenochaeta sp. DS3sAY3a]
MQGGDWATAASTTRPHLADCGCVVKALRLHIQVLAITSSGHANFASGARSRKEDFAASTSPVIDCGKAVADLRFALAQSDHRSASTCSRRLCDPPKRRLAISEKPSATRCVFVWSEIGPVKRPGGPEAKSTRCIDLCWGTNMYQGKKKRRFATEPTVTVASLGIIAFPPSSVPWNSANSVVLWDQAWSCLGFGINQYCPTKLFSVGSTTILCRPCVRSLELPIIQVSADPSPLRTPTIDPPRAPDRRCGETNHMGR